MSAALGFVPPPRLRLSTIALPLRKGRARGKPAILDAQAEADALFRIALTCCIPSGETRDHRISEEVITSLDIGSSQEKAKRQACDRSSSSAGAMGAQQTRRERRQRLTSKERGGPVRCSRGAPRLHGASDMARATEGAARAADGCTRRPQSSTSAVYAVAAVAVASALAVLPCGVEAGGEARHMLADTSSEVSGTAPVSVSGTGVTTAMMFLTGAVLVLGVALSLIMFAWRYAKKPSAEQVKAIAMGKKKTLSRLDSGIVNAHKYSPSNADESVVVPTLKLNDIQVATEGFKQEGVIGDTGHSSVHRAEGPNGEQWVVKRAKRASMEGGHLFRNEVSFLSHVSHDHIVSLLACCDDNNEQILVFEYCPNGTLADWLRPSADGPPRPPLTFVQRVDIALGVAEALRYLHSFTKPTVIHRDVKSDTILLDGDLRAKLGGLGLLKHLPGEAMRLRVTRKKGYLDPEYFQTFKVTTKCDVYAFGVVLLELITARPPVLVGGGPVQPGSPQSPPAAGAVSAQLTPGQAMTLPQWASPLIAQGKVREIADPRMLPPSADTANDGGNGSGGPSDDQLASLARLAAACTAPLRKDRPDMVQVVGVLSHIKSSISLPSVNGHVKGDQAGAGVLTWLSRGSLRVAPV